MATPGAAESRLTHLLICRELPPAAYPPGGIGTYARQISVALAAAGEHVHVIAQRWPGAAAVRDESMDGRLVVHRVALDELPADPALALVPASLLASRCPAQAFAWQAALLAERLIAEVGVDVIEAQEWEAPLYYFLVRRLSGLGPSRRPPVVVHVHSPTARIYAANQWDTSVADFAPLAAMEAFTITRADLVLCPSRFIATEVAADYALDRRRIHVVPYPRPATPLVDRAEAVWTQARICHVGRLEPRKGVIEWADAIARLAPSHPLARFDFVGSDTPLAVTGGRTVQAAMLAALPPDVRPHVRFHGSTDAAGVTRLLGEASMAVVPSRWENFPFSCLEAMASGLPVIASPHGGMREIVDDGVSGWIARDSSPEGLADAARRALATTGERRRAMGRIAAETVTRICDLRTIVHRHLTIKKALTATPAVDGPHAAGCSSVAPGTGDASAEVGIIVVGGEASAIDVTVSHVRAGALASAPVRLAQHVDTLDTAMRALLDSTPHLEALAVVQGGVRVDADAVLRAATALASEPTLGLVVPWLRATGGRQGIVVPEDPSRPFLDAAGAVAGLAIVARRALPATEPTSAIALFEAVMAGGFEARPWPVIGGERVLDEAAPPSPRLSSMALGVQRMHMPVLEWLRTCSPEQRRQFLVDGLRSPARSARWLVDRVSGVWRAPMDRGAVVTTDAPPTESRSKATTA